MQRKPCIFFLACLCGISSLAQRYPFVHYTPKDGLVNNRTRFMFQDSKGLLYISTFGGFSVYDGQRFTNYTMEDGLADPIVNDFMEWGRDTILVVLNTNRMQWLVNGQLTDLTFRNGYCPVVNQLVRSANGTLYALADEGLFQFANNQFSKIEVQGAGHQDLGRNLVYGLEKNNKLFLITDPQVHLFPAPAHLVVYDEKTRLGIIDSLDKVWSVIKSPDADLFLATNMGIRKLDEDALASGHLLFTHIPPPYRAMENRRPSFMYFDHKDDFWITLEEGTYRIGRDDQRVLYSVGNGLLTNQNASIFQDRENSIWFVNGETGISKLTNPRLEYFQQMVPGFTTCDISAEPGSDSIWFLDQKRKTVLAGSGTRFKEFRPGPGPLPDELRFLVVSGHNKVLADKYNVYTFDQNWQGLHAIPVIQQGRDSKGINEILPDGHGNILVLSEEIAVVLTKEKKVISCPIGYFSDHMYLQAGDFLWVATRANQIFKFRLHPDDPDHYFQLVKHFDKELPPMGPRSIAVDKDGQVWVGTGIRGLFCFSLRGDSILSWTQITNHEGLSDTYISDLHADPDGSIWACSTGGLDRIQRKGDHFLIENLTRNQNIYEFVYKVGEDSKGNHWALITSGMIKVPSAGNVSAYRPSILFRDIAFGKTKLDPAGPAASLPYDANNLTVAVAAPTFADEKQVRFSYLLDGSQNRRWSNPDVQSTFSFINLPPGRYALHARAAFINGRYPATETSFSFTILPPWWQTWWFRAASLAAFMLLLGLAVRDYYRRKLYRQQILLDKQQAIDKERSRIAADMHDDLGAGLSSIRYLAERMKRHVFNDETLADLKNMQDTSNDLVDKMNEIIWATNEKNDSLEDLILYTRSYAMQYCEENGLECEAELPEYVSGQIVSGEIRRNVFLTVKECLHNIVKHAKAGRVEVITSVGDSLQIRVSDNGLGLSGHAGNGNGLRNMRQRIESIGGRFEIQNGNGVSVFIEIPLGRH